LLQGTAYAAAALGTAAMDGGIGGNGWVMDVSLETSDRAEHRGTRPGIDHDG
jgi:hypothetical protein